MLDQGSRSTSRQHDLSASASRLSTRILRQAALSGFVIGALALVLRVAAAEALLAASAATVLALGAGTTGLVMHRHNRGRSWRVSWTTLIVALAVLTIATTSAAAAGLPRAYPAPLDWIGSVCALLAAVAFGCLLSSRARGRAVDATLEGLLIATACTYLPWTWGVTRGLSQADAITALIPVAAWIVALWILLRLVFLTNEHIVAYRYLIGAFVCLLAASAIYAGARLGGATLDRSPTLGIVLWGYCLWGAAALHPSLRKNFEPAPPRAPRFGPLQLLLCLAATTVAPLTLAVVAGGHDLRDLEGVLAGSVVVPALLAVYLVRQVRDRTRAEYRAQHDPLTGLPNRTLFLDRMEVAIVRAHRSGDNVAVMFLDLDRFKSINDSLGHSVGNQLLQAVARRLSETVRETDTIARMGGDEFTVLVHVSHEDEAAVVARKIVEQFAIPFVAGGRELHITTSIGIATCPTDGDDVDTLLKHADSAMYRAKARGRNSFEFFTADLSTRAQARLSVESGLRHALENQRLELHYQPQVDVSTGAVVRLEALARWPHTRVGMLMPNVFIPIAEETGLIVSLGDWAIDQACADLRQWLNAEIAPRPVAVNLSARQLSDASLVEKVARILETHDIPPHLLELEITESVFMRDLERSTGTLNDLRDLGVACSIDDFGTGFSGLSYLADMPIASLKVDQSFVSHVRQMDDEAPIIEAIIGLARALHLNVVAEGVESVDQARFLVAHGCSEMQGYLFSPPLPADDIKQLLTLDDVSPTDWLGVPLTDALGNPSPPPPILASETSELLAALCGQGAPVGRDEEIAALLAALLPNETKVPTPSAIRAASLRIAVGSFAGLILMSTGLAAANALPRPVQSVVSSALGTAGLKLPPRAVPIEAHGVTHRGGTTDAAAGDGGSGSTPAPANNANAGPPNAHDGGPTDPAPTKPAPAAKPAAKKAKSTAKKATKPAPKKTKQAPKKPTKGLPTPPTGWPEPIPWPPKGGPKPPYTPPFAGPHKPPPFSPPDQHNAPPFGGKKKPTKAPKHHRKPLGGGSAHHP